MANSKYQYVKNFEQSDRLLPCCWIVVRVDGRSFTRFSQVHGFEKPNDERGLNLMNACAQALLEEITDIVFAYGCSDEYSFVIRKTSTLYQRRASKITSIIVSYFAANYIHKWPEFLPEVKMEYVPAFDARAVCYPADSILKDYLAWRQVDCHINNQYNTCFWALVKSGKSPDEAQQILKGTLADFKNEMLWKDFNINYNELPAMFRKGSALYRKKEKETVKHTEGGEPVIQERSKITITHEDIIKDSFWKEHGYILSA